MGFLLKRFAGVEVFGPTVAVGEPYVTAEHVLIPAFQTSKNTRVKTAALNKNKRVHSQHIRPRIVGRNPRQCNQCVVKRIEIGGVVLFEHANVSSQIVVARDKEHELTLANSRLPTMAKIYHTIKPITRTYPSEEKPRRRPLTIRWRAGMLSINFKSRSRRKRRNIAIRLPRLASAGILKMKQTETMKKSNRFHPCLQR